MSYRDECVAIGVDQYSEVEAVHLTPVIDKCSGGTKRCFYRSSPHRKACDVRYLLAII